jgi:hypothetical protein
MAKVAASVSSSTPVAQAAAQTAGNGVDHTPQAEAGMWARVQAMGQQMGSSPIAMNGKRIIVLIAKIFGYALGTAGVLFAMSYLSTVMLSAGWPLFLIVVLELVGYILGMLASWYASDTVVEFIINGGVKRTIGKVGNLFKRTPKLAAPVAAS